MRKSKLILDFVLESVLDEAIRLSKGSIDDQVDSILLRFESDCIVDEYSADSLGESYLVEAPEDDDEKKEPMGGEAGPKPELGTPEEEKKEKEEDVKEKTGDQDDAKPDEESDPLQPKIDLHKFAGKVSRLASNYDALLDMSIAIVNRARSYLEQNYSEAVGEEFAEIMERDFDIELEREPTGEPRERPIAVGGAATGLSGG